MKKNKILLSFILTLSMLSTTANAAIAGKGDGDTSLAIKPTDAEISKVYQKLNLAKDYVNNKDKMRSTGGSKENYSGPYRQSTSYTCGPAAARNLIYGYLAANGGGTVPTEDTLASELGTTTSGTNWSTTWNTVLNKYAPGNNYAIQWGGSNWSNTVRVAVIYDIDKSGNYNVIADLNHGSTSTPVNPIYSNGAAHYISVYGYDDTTGSVNINDSNSAAALYYKTSFTNLANSTYARGIAW